MRLRARAPGNTLSRKVSGKRKQLSEKTALLFLCLVPHPARPCLSLPGAGLFPGWRLGLMSRRDSIGKKERQATDIARRLAILESLDGVPWVEPGGLWLLGPVPA